MLMLTARVRPRLFADEYTVVDVPPVLWSGISRIDAQSLDDINRLQHLFDLRPAKKMQQNFTAWAHIGDGRVALTRTDRAHDIDARDAGAMVVAYPTYERKDAVGGERD